MRNVTTSTIVSLLFKNKPDINFRSYVAELELALRSSEHENFDLTWEYDDFAVFDIDGSRVVAACCNTLRDRDKSGTGECRAENPDDEYSEMMLLAVGYGLKTGGSTLVADHREEICRSVVGRIQASNPPDLVLWRSFDHPFTPEDFDQLIADLPFHSQTVEHPLAIDETVVDQGEDAETVSPETPEAEQDSLLPRKDRFADPDEDTLWQRCELEFQKQSEAPETPLAAEAESDEVATDDTDAPETGDQPAKNGVVLTGEAGPSAHSGNIWARVAEKRSHRKNAPRPQTIRLELSGDDKAERRRSLRPDQLAKGIKPNPPMPGLEPPRPKNLKAASNEWEAGSRTSLPRPGPINATIRIDTVSVANDTPDIPAPMSEEMQKLRAALYDEEKPQGFHFGPAVKAPLPQRLTTYTFNATLLVVALPVGAALLTYNVLGREDLGVTARAMALTGAAIGFAQTGYGEVLLRFI